MKATRLFPKQSFLSLSFALWFAFSIVDGSPTHIFPPQKASETANPHRATLTSLPIPPNAPDQISSTGVSAKKKWETEIEDFFNK